MPDSSEPLATEGIMIVRQAKDLAAQWVIEEASKTPGFYGAYFAGSTNWMHNDAPFPATSDVDIKVVIDDSHPSDAFGKFLYRDVMLEISYISSDQFQSPDTILGDYPSAAHFTTPNIIADPSGQLTKIQAAVAQNYTNRYWVHRRCENARDWLLTSLQWLNESDPFHDQVFAWLYPTSIPTHIVLVADLKNPTVRRMFVAAREILTKYGYLSLYESMLGILGSVGMRRKQVQDLLGACVEVFDSAKQVIKTPFFGASSISDDARSLAIDGSRELIDCGDHREAVFWIAVTHTWCQKALFNDAPVELQQRFTPSYQRLLGELGVTSLADLQQRTEQLKNLLPRIWEVTEAIIAANPEIVD
jgi:hypothetical protein